MFERSRPTAALRPPRRRGILSTSVSLLGAAVAVPLALAACVAPSDGRGRPEPFTETLVPDEGLVDGSSSSVQPGDVWLQPVGDQSSGRGAPTGALRDELYRGLVDRLYTPIALGWGDARLAEAASGGDGFPTEAIGAEAVMEVVVTVWDSSLLERSGIVYAEAEARLIDPGTDPPAQLWGRRLARRLQVDSARLRQSTVGELEELVARLLAREVLGLVPQRDPVRAAIGE